MKAVLVDDEQLAIDELLYLLEGFKNIDVVETFTKPKSALEYLILNDIDVLFIDVSMPEMDGFILAEAVLRLRKPPFIVFVTAYDEYAIKAFEINAMDYLLKPATEERLKKTISKLSDVIENIEIKDVNSHQVKEIVKGRYIDKVGKRIPLWKGDRIHLISPEGIACIETKEGETTIYAKGGIFISSESLTHYEEILKGYGFYRCHRNYLIRMDAIEEVIPWFNNTYQVKLNGYDGENIPISRRNVKEFKRRLGV